MFSYLSHNRRNNHLLYLRILLHVALSFFPGLIILTLYFSSILTGSSKKRTFYTRAFVISFSGLAIGAVCALATPFLPQYIPSLEIGFVLAVITWVFLLRRYCGTGWLESFPPAFIAAIVYLVIIAAAAGLLMIFP